MIAAIICRNYGEHICLASGWADVLFCAYRRKWFDEFFEIETYFLKEF